LKKKGIKMIKIKLRPDKKAMIRFKNDGEINFLSQFLCQIRDDKIRPHPHISIKDINGDEMKNMNHVPMKLNLKKAPVVVKPPEVVKK